MAGEPLILKKETINMKMLLIIGGLVIIFFLFIYPSFKKEHIFGFDPTIGIKNLLTTEKKEKEEEVKEHMDISTMMMPEMTTDMSTPPTDMTSYQPPISTEHFSYSVEPFDQYENYDTIEHMGEDKPVETTSTQLPNATPIELPDYVKKLLAPEHMTNYKLERMQDDDEEEKDRMTNYTLERMQDDDDEEEKEYMSDVMKGNKMDAFGSLSNVNNGSINNFKLENMMCSKSCCSTQWGMDTNKDNRISPNDIGSKFFATNYMCSGDNPNDKGNGCVCMTKDMFSYLGNRGGNNSE